MTDIQKYCFLILLRGGSMSARENGKAGIKNDRGEIERVVFSRTAKMLRRVCRKGPGFWVIDLRIVRSLHGNHWAKKEYKKYQDEKKASHAEA